ncbi:MAG TPA: hypothetical protein VEL31_14115 [Ktedonobacteraceae bacterium]|nr:hypothetical protein [Ktedonobacteraceae bacterium]
MDWPKLVDSVLVCTTVLLIVGMACFTVIVCCLYDKATDSPENVAKVLATLKEQTQGFRPRPRE